MDDAHQIVLVGLEQAGVVLPSNVVGAQDIGQADLVAICSQAVSLVRNVGAASKVLPTVLPSALAEKFRVCTDLAGAIKQLGYSTDLSFHQFLYPSKADTHRLLRFLLDKLSKTSASGRNRGSRKGRGGLGRRRNSDEEIGGSSVGAAVRQSLSQWRDAINWSEGKDAGSRAVREWRREEPLEVGSVRRPAATFSAFLTARAESRDVLVPFVLELNAQRALKATSYSESRFVHDAADGELGKEDQGLTLERRNAPEATPDKRAGVGSSFLRSVKFTDGREWSPVWSRDLESKVPAKATKVPNREGGPAAAPGEAGAFELEQKFSGLSIQAEKIEEVIRNLQHNVETTLVDNKVATDTARLRDENVQLLERAVNLALHSRDPPEASIWALESNIREKEVHIAGMEAEWGMVRSALENEKAELEKSAYSNKDAFHSKLKVMKEIRQEMKRVSLKIHSREQEQSAMTSELKALKGAARSTYVRRISELIRNSKKQDADITRIINDTRDLQRDSNAAQDRLRRSHALVDELVFRDAKHDAVCRQAYMLLSTVHMNFADIVDKVYEMDKTGREVTELQAILEDLEKRSLDASSVQADLNAVVSENKTLETLVA